MKYSHGLLLQNEGGHRAMGFLGLILVGTPKRSAKRRILVIELRTMAGKVVLLLLPQLFFGSWCFLACNSNAFQWKFFSKYAIYHGTNPLSRFPTCWLVANAGKHENLLECHVPALLLCAELVVCAIAWWWPTNISFDMRGFLSSS